MFISKEQAALYQLCDAIGLFRNERYISALTLSAASEEILAQLVKQDATKKKLPKKTAEDLETALFDISKEIHGIKNYRSYRNNIKNELKHHGNETNKDVLNVNFRSIALNHIVGAIVNYKFLHNYFPKEELITDFRNEMGIN